MLFMPCVFSLVAPVCQVVISSSLLSLERLEYLYFVLKDQMAPTQALYSQISLCFFALVYILAVADVSFLCHLAPIYQCPLPV